MSLNELFIPGQWVDTIDVNDFVNLNKKPFLNEPFFLSNSTSSLCNSFYNQIKEALENFDKKIILDFSSLESNNFNWCDLEFKSNPFEYRVGFSENLFHMKDYYHLSEYPSRFEGRKTSYELFDEVSTSETKKMIKMGLFSHTPTDFSPFFLHPDVRMIPLYGTKQIIKEKRYDLKNLEKLLQTHEWVQRRILIHREIDAIKKLESFCKKQGVDITMPAENAEQAITSIYLTTVASFLENSSIPFTFSLILPFLDIYLEYDIKKGILTEEKAQELIDLFYLRLTFIQFLLSPGLAKNHSHNMHFLGETFSSKIITKTSYRFLFSIEKFQVYPFSIRVFWNDELPIFFKNVCERIVNKGFPISFYTEDESNSSRNVCIYPYSQKGIPGDDILLDAGSCDLSALLFLSLNGGKDVKQNINLRPITQPIRKNKLMYEEVLSKFKDFLSYTVSSYVESMNMVMYLNEIQQYHPLRSSLSNYMQFYQIQFGFHRFHQTVLLLDAIMNDSFELKKDKGGWVTDIVPLDFESDSYDGVAINLIQLIQTEIKKIPIYKNGKSLVRIYPYESFNTFTVRESENLFVVPKEIVNVSFHLNIVDESLFTIENYLEKMFSKGFQEVHLSKNDEIFIANGILFSKK